MAFLRVDDPTEAERFFDRTFNPGSAIADAPAGRRLASRVATFFNGTKALRVTDVAEDKASYRHRMSGAGLLIEMLHSSSELHKVIRSVMASDISMDSLTSFDDGRKMQPRYPDRESKFFYCGFTVTGCGTTGFKGSLHGIAW